MIERIRSSITRRLGIAELRDRIDVLEGRLAEHGDVHDGIRDAHTRLDHLERVHDHAVRVHDARLRRLESLAHLAAGAEWAATAPLRHEPLISVVLATRNRAHLLPSAIVSVLEQTYSVWELVVVDDGSTDDTAAIVRELTDPRVRLEKTDGVGAAAARNVGVQAATGDYVAFVDDDNLMARGWLRAVAEFTGRRHEVTAVFGAAVREDAASPGDVPWVQFEPDLDRSQLADANSVDLGTLAVRRDHPQLSFDESLRRFIDWDLVVRLVDNGGLTPLPAFAAVYTTRADDRISSHADDEATNEMRRRFERS